MSHELVLAALDIFGDVGLEIRVPYRLESVAVDCQARRGAECRDADEYSAPRLDEAPWKIGLGTVGDHSGIVLHHRVKRAGEIAETAYVDGAEHNKALNGEHIDIL